MRNLSNIYLIVCFCLECYIVFYEKFVNEGGYLVGSGDFELVVWF